MFSNVICCRATSKCVHVGNGLRERTQFLTLSIIANTCRGKACFQLSEWCVEINLSLSNIEIHKMLILCLSITVVHHIVCLWYNNTVIHDKKNNRFMYCKCLFENMKCFMSVCMVLFVFIMKTGLHIMEFIIITCFLLLLFSLNFLI